jgi:hypothetical protein
MRCISRTSEANVHDNYGSAKANLDKPAETGRQNEFGSRYFGAAAPGTIIIGMRRRGYPRGIGILG